MGGHVGRFFTCFSFVYLENRMSYSTYCEELGVDLSDKTVDEVLKLIDEHIEVQQSKHICVSELEPPADQSTLQRCGRCKLVYYGSTEAQKVSKRLFSFKYPSIFPISHIFYKKKLCVIIH
jgi:hypothetical protein